MIKVCAASDNYTSGSFTADEWQISSFQSGSNYYLPWFYRNQVAGAAGISIFPKIVTTGNWYHWFVSFDGGSSTTGKIVCGTGLLGDSTGSMGRRTCGLTGTGASEPDNDYTILSEDVRLQNNRGGVTGGDCEMYGWRITEGVARYGDPGSDGHSTGTYTMPNAYGLADELGTAPMTEYNITTAPA